MASRSRPEQAAGKVILKVIQQPVQGAARYGELTQVAKEGQIPVEQGHQSLVRAVGEAASEGSISQGVEA